MVVLSGDSVSCPGVNCFQDISVKMVDTKYRAAVSRQGYLQIPLIFYSAFPSNANMAAAILLTYGYQTASILLEKLTVAQPVEKITAFY
jgi:hypothetical protein